MPEFIALTLVLEVKYTGPPSADPKHAPFPTPRIRKTQDAISVACDNHDKRLPSI